MTSMLSERRESCRSFASVTRLLDHAPATFALIAGLCASAADAAAASEPRVEVVTPGPGYGGGWVKRLFLGGQWRDVWTTPVEVPVLDLKTFDGGLRPVRRGGGLQTTCRPRGL